MAAVDKFETINKSLSPEAKAKLRELVARKGEELLALRSEDARVRLVSDYEKEVMDWLAGSVR
jgi:hypothetical protein